GETRILLPSEFGGTEGAWRYLFNFTAKGATVTEDGPGVRVLHHKPGAPITVRYAVQTAYQADPAGADGNPYRGPVSRPGGVALLGEVVVAAPEDRGGPPGALDLGKLPKGWRAVSDVDRSAQRPVTIDQVTGSVTLAGPGLPVLERQITGGT